MLRGWVDWPDLRHWDGVSLLCASCANYVFPSSAFAVISSTSARKTSNFVEAYTKTGAAGVASALCRHVITWFLHREQLPLPGCHMITLGYNHEMRARPFNVEQLLNINVPFLGIDRYASGESCRSVMIGSTLASFTRFHRGVLRNTMIMGRRRLRRRMGAGCRAEFSAVEVWPPVSEAVI